METGKERWNVWTARNELAYESNTIKLHTKQYVTVIFPVFRVVLSMCVQAAARHFFIRVYEVSIRQLDEQDQWFDGRCASIDVHILERCSIWCWTIFCTPPGFAEEQSRPLHLSPRTEHRRGILCGKALAWNIATVRWLEHLHSEHSAPRGHLSDLWNSLVLEPSLNTFDILIKQQRGI